MVASNVMSMSGRCGGTDNKTISEEHPTYVTPDGMTFAIWGLIYLLETATVIVQLFASESSEVLLEQQGPPASLDVRTRLALTFLANAFWLPLWANERFWPALGVMLVYLMLLLSVYQDLNTASCDGVFQYTLFAAGIAMNTSWIIVASLVNIVFCAGEAGWKDQQGVAGSVPAAIVAAIFVSCIACERALRACDLPWAFVAAWALQGISRMQSIPDKARFPLGAMSSRLASCAYWCSILVLVAMVAGVAVKLCG
jgi:hypothetical protein